MTLLWRWVASRALYCRTTDLSFGADFRQHDLNVPPRIRVTSQKSELQVAMPHSWYRAQKPLSPEIQKYAKKIRPNSPPQVRPRKYEEHTEKTQKQPKTDRFSYSFCMFSCFGARPGVGSFAIFFVFFSYFRAWGVFELYTRNAESQAKNQRYGLVEPPNLNRITLSGGLVFLQKMALMRFWTQRSDWPEKFLGSLPN